MTTQTEAANPRSRWKLSLDTWAVLLAFLAALLIHVGIFKHVPW